MQADRVGLGQHVVDRHRLARKAGGHARAAPSDDAHAEAGGDACHLAADAAEAKEAEGAAGELEALRLRPRAGTQAPVHARDAARRGEQQREGVLRDAAVAIAPDRAHAHAEPRGGVEVDIAGRAGAQEHDRSQAWKPLEQRRVHGRVPVQHDPGVGDRRAQLGGIGIALEDAKPCGRRHPRERRGHHRRAVDIGDACHPRAPSLSRRAGARGTRRPARSSARPARCRRRRHGRPPCSRRTARRGRVPPCGPPSCARGRDGRGRRASTW